MNRKQYLESIAPGKAVRIVHRPEGKNGAVIPVAEITDTGYALRDRGHELGIEVRLDSGSYRHSGQLGLRAAGFADALHAAGWIRSR